MYYMGMTIRPAVSADVPLVAASVLAAVDLADLSRQVTVENTAEYSTALEVCAREDTLFSYRNAVIVCLDGKSIGCLVSYDGALYQKAREITFRMFRERLGNENSSYDVETGPGEYYLDSLAILPEYRGRGIGLQVMQYAIDRAFAQGFRRVTLLTDSNAPHKERYYSNLGFKPLCRLHTFGSEFIKMYLDAVQ